MRTVNKQDAERFSTGSTEAAWRTSSRCSHGDCVQVGAFPARAVAVRDTKNRGSGPDLVFSLTEWSSFIRGIKQGGTTA